MNRRSVCVRIAAITAFALLVSCGDSPTEEDDVFAGDIVACPVGAWAMGQPSLDLLVATVVPVPGIRVTEGILDLWFDPDKEFTYRGNFTVQIDLDPAERSYLEGEGVFETTGRYTVEGDTIIFDLAGNETGAVRWRGFKNGLSVEVPGEPPTISLSLPALAPYRCSDHSLEIDTLGPAGTVTMFFRR